MQDLRLLAIEQDFVVLEGANGEKFRLPLDESVRKALRSERSPRVELDTISPREIQELVRSGHNVEEIVSKTGAPFSFVEKFAVPVLEELEHQVNSALSVRLSFLGERYGETNHIEFGVLIRERLEQLGAVNIAWSSRRSETGGTQIHCNFELAGNPSIAKWSFDIRHLSLSPDNEVALNLAANPRQDSLLSKPKPIIESQPTDRAEPDQKPIVATTDISPSAGQTLLVTKNLTSSLGDTQEFATVIPFGRGRNTTAQVPVVAAGTSAEIEDETDALDENEDLLAGLRRRRDIRESKSGFTPLLEVVRDNSLEHDAAWSDDIAQEAHFDENIVWIESNDEVFVDEDNQSQVVEHSSQAGDLESQTQDAKAHDAQTEVEQDQLAHSPAQTTVASPKRGRASMPSWDEIVFGTKPDSKDD